MLRHESAKQSCIHLNVTITIHKSNCWLITDRGCINWHDKILHLALPSIALQWKYIMEVIFSKRNQERLIWKVDTFSQTCNTCQCLCTHLAIHCIVFLSWRLFFPDQSQLLQWHLAILTTAKNANDINPDWQGQLYAMLSIITNKITTTKQDSGQHTVRDIPCIPFIAQAHKDNVDSITKNWLSCWRITIIMEETVQR